MHESCIYHPRPKVGPESHRSTGQAQKVGGKQQQRCRLRVEAEAGGRVRAGRWRGDTNRRAATVHADTVCLTHPPLLLSQQQLSKSLTLDANGQEINIFIYQN